LTTKSASFFQNVLRSYKFVMTKVVLKKNLQKYMITAENDRTIRDVERQNFWSRQGICVFGNPGDTEQRRESGDTEENRDCE
jgi:hypothetical protein